MGEIRPFEGKTGKRAYVRQAYNVRYGPKSGSSSQAMLVRQAAGFPQALVKVVRNAGAKTAKGLLGQAAYLAREGSLDLRDSPLGDVGWELSDDELKEKLQGWAENWRGNPRLGHTTHMIVSYPKGTDPIAAHEAALEFGEQAFAMGLGGDSYDYVSVQHLDTDYPHTHFLINNQGAFDKGWFTIKRGGAHDVNVLREIQVETGAQFGIDLAATRRLERGILEKPVLTREYREAKAAGTTPVERPLSASEREAVELIVLDHADRFDALAKVYSQEDAGRIAGLLKQSAELLREGERIEMDQGTLDPREWTAVERVEMMKVRLAENIERGEKALLADTDVAVQAMREIRLADVKSDAARFFPERKDFKSFAKKEPFMGYVQDAYRFDGVLPPDEQALAEQRYAKAEAAIMDKARSMGIEPEKVVGRYEANRPVNRELAARWGRDEVSDIVRNRPDVSEAQATRDVTEYHRFVRAQYSDANRDIESMARERGVEVAPVLKRSAYLTARAEEMRREGAREAPSPSRNRGPDRDDRSR